jgi:hypothetical protein
MKENKLEVTKTTIRNVPRELHLAIRLKAWSEKKTMNDIMLEALYNYFEIERK